MSWPLVTLGEIVENCNSKRIPLKQADRLERVGDYDYYGASGVIDTIDDYLFDGDYLLIGEDGNNLISRSSPIAFHARGKFWVNNHAHVLKSNGKADLGFLAYYINSINLEPYVTGSAQPKLNKKNLDSIKIPLPPLDEQKRIAAILDKADAIRRKRQQAIQLADDFLRSVFLDMFGDPVINPKEWEVKSLKELTYKLGSGSTPRGGKEAYLEEGISLIRSLNVHDNKFLHKNLAFISEQQAEKLKNVVIEKDDLLLNITGASVCRASLVDSDILPARVNQHVCIIRTKPDKILPTFLARLITSSSYKQKLMSIATAGGATREALTKQQVESLQIIVPPLEVQKKFESIVGRALQLLKNSELQSQKPLFNSLTQKAFAGEL